MEVGEDEGCCWPADLPPLSLRGRAPSGLLSLLVTLTGRAESLPEYRDRNIRVVGWKVPLRDLTGLPRAGAGWEALDVPLGADVPARGWRRGSPT